MDLLPHPLRVVPQPVMNTSIGVPGSDSALLALLWAHVARAAPVMIVLASHLHALGLRPRQHTEQQHLSHDPHALGQSCRHGWCPWLPAFGGAGAVGRLGSGQREA